jgi:hypothetical protein
MNERLTPPIDLETIKKEATQTAGRTHLQALYAYIQIMNFSGEAMIRAVYRAGINNPTKLREFYVRNRGEIREMAQEIGFELDK